MEKYSQYRDKGSGIAPFFAIPHTPSGLYLPVYLFLFTLRLPILIFTIVAYFAVFCWLPIGSLGKKAALWLILAVPGIWWVDLQIDGVKKGTLSKHSPSNPSAPFPRPGSIIASSLTSPLDALYLAAVFDPIFTISYPESRLLRPCSLLMAILHPLLPSSLNLSPAAQGSKNGQVSGQAPGDGDLTTLAELSAQNPDRIILVFPECTPSNGRGILPLSPSLLSAPPRARIFPTSLRYTPADITTPIPGLNPALQFLWNLCSRPTHTVRVRIAEGLNNSPATAQASVKAITPPVKNSYATNFLDSLDKGVFKNSDNNVAERLPAGPTNGTKALAEDGRVTEAEQALLDRVAEALARLGRVKRVGLGVMEKGEFVRRWTKRKLR